MQSMQSKVIEQFYSISQVAQRIGHNTETVRRLIVSGRLHARSFGFGLQRRHWRVSERDLGRFLDSAEPVHPQPRSASPPRRRPAPYRPQIITP